MTITKALFVLGTLLAALYGWIANIVTIFGLTVADSIGEIVVRVIGVFIPFIGAILGYF
jgi:hypothetical protein